MLVNTFIRRIGLWENSLLPETEKHPIILPVKDHVTRLLISQAHMDTLHGGPALVMRKLACKFWIVARNTVRSILRSCVRCTRLRAKTLGQMMGPLPAVRLTPTHPFIHSGLDFARTKDMFVFSYVWPFEQ